MAKEGSYTYQEDRTVTLPVASDSFAIEKREWNRLKNLVSNCKTNREWFMSIAFSFFGFAGSAFITWLSLGSQEGMEITRLILMMATIVSLLMGVICLVFQWYLNKNHSDSIESIKDEIQFIEGGIPPEDV